VPDTLWATDPTEGWTRLEGRCAVFCIVDHATGEAWVDAATRMDRFAAADLLREVVSERFGSLEAGVATGVALRHDGGSCFTRAHYQAEIDFLGLERSPAFHYEPETNGCAEKFIQTLKEQVLWIERSTPSTSCVPASASSPASTTGTGCSSGTATARRTRPASSSWPVRTDDRSVAASPPRPADRSQGRRSEPVGPDRVRSRPDQLGNPGVR
jgi:hypothetical protein